MKKSQSPLMTGALCVFLVFLLSTWSQAQVLTFTETNLTVGSGPAQAVAADFSGNGYPGVVCANFGFAFGADFATGSAPPFSGWTAGTTLTIYTNDGAGNLYFDTTLDVEAAPVSVAAVDLNGDGKADLVCGNVAADSVSVYINDGHGNFPIEDIYNTGTHPVGLAMADVNGDGAVDIITANAGGSTLSIFTNNGFGGFIIFSTVSVSDGPASVAAADFNGDGSIDLAVAYTNSDQVTVLTNNGKGVFKEALSGEVVGGAGWVTATDVNQDGKQDLIAVGPVVGTNSIISVLTNTGHASFKLAFSTNVTGASTVEAADFNGDGKIDLLCNYNGNFYQTYATILTNNGRGKFILNTTLPAGYFQTLNYPNFVAAADFNGDGNMDAAESCFGSGVVTVFTQTGKVGRPTVTITSPANDSVLSTSTPFLVTLATRSTNPVEVVLYYVDGTTTILGAAENAPFTITNTPGRLSAGTHSLQAEAVDSKGNLSWSREVQLNITASTGPKPPTIRITSPANGATISSDAVFTMKAAVTVPSGTYVGLVNFIADGSNVLQRFFSAPFSCPIYPGTLSPGVHTLVADVVDENGGSAVSTPITINIKQVASPLSVSITSPTNWQAFSVTNPITVKSSVKPSGQVSLVVLLYVDGTNIAETVFPPYSFTNLFFAAGEHTLYEIANGVNGLATSAVTHITINPPGTSLINFDALNTTAGAVSGTALTLYLAGYGVTLSNVTLGTTLEAVNQSNFTGTVQAFPSSAPNLFTQAGASGTVSFTLGFAQPLQAVEFTRVALSADATGFITHPAWTATAYDTNGDELSSVGEGLIVTNAFSIPQRMFTLAGKGIASVTFSSDSEGVAAFSAILMDDLILSQNPVASLLTISLETLSPTNDLVAPATLELGASVTDSISSSYSVSYYAGLTLLGTVSQTPYQFTWTNALPGRDNLHASVTDSSGATARSAAVPILVHLEPDSTELTFENLATKNGPLEGTMLRNYLGKRGIVASVSPGTSLAVERQGLIGGGKALVAPSGSNVLTQVGSNGPAQFTLTFTNALLSQFGFTRPELLANPFVSFPGWRATAYDSAGAVVDTIGRSEIDSATDVGELRHSLRAQPGGPGIAQVEFSSFGTGQTTFPAVVVDDLILTTNPGPFAPAVKITKPINGRVLTQPPSVTVIADASDGAGGAGIASVAFYETQIIPGANSFTVLISNVTTAPYKVDWKPGARIGADILTAVASSFDGLTWTSAPVAVTIVQPATQFGILSAPADQVVPAGGSATFSVTTTGTGPVTYQWSAETATNIGNLTDNGHISGATSPTLTINPPITDADAGTYAVSVTSGGVTIPAYATLTVIDAPTFTEQPQGRTVDPGTTVILSPSATSSGPLTWQWLLNGTPIPGATNRVYSILAAQALQSGNYQVEAANQTASALSAVAPVVVTTPTVIPFTNDFFANAAVINPLLGTVSADNTQATIEKNEPAPLPGYAPSKSIWFAWRPEFNGTVSLTTAGSDFDTVMAVYTGTALSNLKPVAADDDSGGFLTSLVTFNVTAGTLYYIAVDGFQGASGRVVLGFPAGNGYRALNPASGDSVPIIVRQPASKVVAPNSTVTLSVAAASATKITYQWLFQGTPIAGATGSSLTIHGFQAGSVGVYTVVVANETGSAQSEAASLQIANDQGTTPTLTQNKLLTGSGTTPAKVAFNVTPFAVGGDTRGFTVSQTFSTVGGTAEPGEPQPCGQVPSASQWFAYQAQTEGTLEVDTGGSTYNTLLGVYTGNGSSFAELTEVGCGFATNFATEGQPSVTIPGVAKGETFYIVIDGYQGATGLAQLHLGLGSPLTLSNMPPNLAATAGSNVTMKVGLLAGSIPSSYEWQLNGADVPGGTGATKSSYVVTNAQEDAVGNYSVIVSNVVGVVTSSPTSLTLQYAPLIVAGPTNETVALGKPAKFSVTAVGVNAKTNPFHCQWYVEGGGAIPRATGLTLSFPTTVWTNNGSYYLVISNSYGSVTSAPATLTVTDSTLPTVAITSPRNGSTVTTNVVTITGTASDRVGVADVVVQANNGPIETASGLTKWTAQVTLTNGVNTIIAQSADVPGNFSAVATIKVTYKP